MISRQEFADRYGVSVQAVNTFLSKNPEFKIRQGNRVFVDNEAIEEIEAKHLRFWHFATTIYYPLIEIFDGEYNLAKRLAIDTSKSADSWYSYIDKCLFTMPATTILDIRIPRALIEFCMLGAKYLYLFKRDYCPNLECVEND